MARIAARSTPPISISAARSFVTSARLLLCLSTANGAGWINDDKLHSLPIIDNYELEMDGPAGVQVARLRACAVWVHCVSPRQGDMRDRAACVGSDSPGDDVALPITDIATDG